METYRSGHNGTDSKSVVPPGTVGSNPTVSAKPKKRAHLAPFFHDSDCSHLLYCKLPCPHVRKNTLCNLLFAAGAFYSLNPFGIIQTKPGLGGSAFGLLVFV